jgi:hypothetical protein
MALTAAPASKGALDHCHCFWPPCLSYAMSCTNPHPTDPRLPLVHHGNHQIGSRRRCHCRSLGELYHPVLPAVDLIAHQTLLPLPVLWGSSPVISSHQRSVTAKKAPMRRCCPPPHQCPASTVSFRPHNLARPIAPTSAVPIPSTSLSESRRRLLTSRAAARGQSTVNVLGCAPTPAWASRGPFWLQGRVSIAGPPIENGPALFTD